LFSPVEGIEVIETEWGSELHQRLVAEDAGGEYVMVGGLAVGAWASAFNVGDGNPMFSKDIDLRGTRLAAKAVAQALKREGATIIRVRFHHPKGTTGSEQELRHPDPASRWQSHPGGSPRSLAMGG
jgi:hypothetical protein